MFWSSVTVLGPDIAAILHTIAQHTFHHVTPLRQKYSAISVFSAFDEALHHMPLLRRFTHPSRPLYTGGVAANSKPLALA